MAWRKKKDSRPTVEALCAEHRNEESHTRYVASLALQIFDAVRAPFNLHRRDRLILETAARLHDIGYASAPENHIAEGIGIVQKAGLRGFTDAQRNEIIAIMALHAPLPDTELAGRLANNTSRPSHIFQLGAILRVADAIDHSHLQNSKILDIRIRDGMVHLRISAPKGSGNPERAMAKSDLWQRVFALGLVIEPVWRGVTVRPRNAEPARRAIRRLLLAHYHVLRTSVRRAARTDDEKALHDLRIAVRFMRRILEAFQRPLRKTSAESCADQLRSLAKRISPARDADVWVSLLSRPRYASALVDASEFLDRQRVEQQRARVELRAILNDTATTTLLTQLGVLLRTELAGAPEKGGRPFGPVARRQVRALWKAMLEKKAWAESRKPNSLHSFRIRLRRLRILATLVAPLLSKDRTWFIETLRELERNLGRIHDLDVALMRAASVQAPPALISAFARRRRKEMKRFRALWAQFNRPALLKRCKAVFQKPLTAES